MKSTAILINEGRGGIVVESDLAKALNQKQIKAACLDVLEAEPIQASNPLLQINEPHRLMITPHIAWSSVEARQRLMEGIFTNIRTFLAQ